MISDASVPIACQLVLAPRLTGHWLALSAALVHVQGVRHTLQMQCKGRHKILDRNLEKFTRSLARCFALVMSLKNGSSYIESDWPMCFTTHGGDNPSFYSGGL